MSSILFWDPSCLRPYDSHTIATQASGGTESSLSRIADALGAYVIQHNRTEASGRYRPPGRIPGIAHVVVNRDSRALHEVRQLYPDARFYLWVHDQIHPRSTRGRRLAATAAIMRELSVQVVCVSDSQRRGVEATLLGMHGNDHLRACTIYNPIDGTLAPDGSPIDPNKLVFFSSPNKGLKFTLDAFQALRRRMPELYLVVGNPGYKNKTPAEIAGVTYLGAQPQARIHAEVRSALCTFFPNFVIPETFGLVFAESLALGTPVLTHDCGAASEVIGDPEQVLPVTFWQRAYETSLSRWSSHLRQSPARLADRLGLFDAYCERLGEWRAGARPQTRPDPRFNMAVVTAQWRSLLAD
jgi:glycosyltransferase involved in cell wall biosynthesis